MTGVTWWEWAANLAALAGTSVVAYVAGRLGERRAWERGTGWRWAATVELVQRYRDSRGGGRR